MGKLWLEKGGVFVMANIRGGGEFGPAWHEAGLTTHRQRILTISRPWPGPGRARHHEPEAPGDRGWIHGGLLMGVEFNQHPEMWNAVDIQVPLLDMIRV